MEKLKIPYPIIVEGKYDKNTLSQLFDGVILSVGGFSVFNSKEKQSLLRKMARDGIVILTDSDGGGRQIRSFLSGILPADKIHNAFVPKIEGKEKRKKAPGAAGLLGVEGQERALLFELLAPFADAERVQGEPITKVDFFEDGLTGAAGAAERRNALAALFDLPPDMTPNALLAALSVIATKEEYKAAVEKI